MKKSVKVLTLLVVINVFMFSFSSYVFADDKLGDLNKDGKVDNKDVDMLEDYVALMDAVNRAEEEDENGNKIVRTQVPDIDSKTREQVESNGDLNRDGKVDQDDWHELNSMVTSGSSSTGVPDATSCAGFKKKKYCIAGIGKDGARFGCAWNDKYDFCSANGLAYLSCGIGDTDAHDIPVFAPRITSYGITILKTVTPVILIIMSMLQMIKAISSQSEDEIKKAKSSLVKKLIVATLIFFVTTIVQFIIKQAADDSEVGSANQCLSCFVNNDCNGSTYFVDGYGYCYYLSDRSKPVATTNGNCQTDIGVLEGLVPDDTSQK